MNKELIVNNKLDAMLVEDIISIEREIKKLKVLQDAYKQQILEEMEENNILKLETDELSISYIAGTDRETFDTKKFKEDNIDLYDKYVRMSHVKPSISIKVKLDD